MNDTNELLRSWLKKATTYEQERLAQIAKTARGYLYKLVIGYRPTTVEIAVKLEKASKVLAKESKGRLPILARQDMTEICAECPYSPKCKIKG